MVLIKGKTKKHVSYETCFLFINREGGYESNHTYIISQILH
nr:MAG TPA: hypothetical protein [Caudoviricetes sp.]